MPGRIAGVMDVVDALDFRMRLDRHRVEAAHLSHRHEGRLQLAERLHRRGGTHVLVLGEKREAVDVLHRDHRILEAALVPGFRRALLALHRIGVDVVARKTVFGRDQVGRHALRHEVGRHRHRRIHRPGAAGGADADAAHRFGAAADGEFMLAAHDLGGGEIHRIEARGAEPADLDAGDRLAETGLERGEARDIGAGLADRIDHAEHDVVDDVFGEVVALLQGFQRCRRQCQRGHLVQRAIGLAAAARRANVIVDICLRHPFSPVSVSALIEPDELQNSQIVRSSLRGALLSAEARLRAKADATRQSSPCMPLDRFAEPVIGRAFARPVGSQ